MSLQEEAETQIEKESPVSLPKNPKRKLGIGKFLKNYGTPISILVGSVIIASSLYAAKTAPVKSNVQAKNSVAGIEASGSVDVSADSDPFLGNEKAPVTIIEFSDFQCPYCRRFWRQTFSQIKAQYIDTGKVRFVYRDFPLSIHPSSEIAAEAGECANEQGKFWQMHDKIFAQQDKQGEGTITFGISDLKKWAQEIGLDTSQFNSCLDSSKYRDEVAKDFQDAQNAGVLGTPAFFINGKLISGAQPTTVFTSAIEAALKK